MTPETTKWLRCRACGAMRPDDHRGSCASCGAPPDDQIETDPRFVSSIAPPAALLTKDPIAALIYKLMCAYPGGQIAGMIRDISAAMKCNPQGIVLEGYLFAAHCEMLAKTLRGER